MISVSLRTIDRNTNSLDVIHNLEMQYRVNVTRVDPKLWEQMTLKEQASLLNSFPRILIPHGGHEGGLIFCRPKTCIIELQCLENETASLLQDTVNVSATTDIIEKNNFAYYGPPNFYTTYTRRIDIEHFVIGEAEGCRGRGSGRHYSPHLVANVTRFVQFVANRWRLTPRDIPQRL